MDTPTTTRRPTCLSNKNDGLVPQADNNNPLISRPLCLQRRSSLRNIYSYSIMSSSSRSSSGKRLCDARFEDPQPHFLDACFLCKKTLGHNNDIFMYRGDIPFCSVECRQEQIEMDEAKEKKLNFSASIKAMKEKDQRKSTSPNKTYDYLFPRDTVAAA